MIFNNYEKKYNELENCTDLERKRSLIELLKISQMYCVKILREPKFEEYHDEISLHMINVFEVGGNWDIFRKLENGKYKELILNKLQYYPSKCCQLILDKKYNNEKELDCLLIGVSKTSSSTLECFSKQTKENMLSLEKNMILYKKVINEDNPRYIIEALIKTKKISAIRNLLFEVIISNLELSMLIINDIKILTALLNDEKKAFYNKYSIEIFNKYKSTKVGYFEYCTSFKDEIGFNEKKLYIDKVFKHMKGIEILRHLKILSYNGESKEYLDSLLIINKLRE